jgi:hypothetical protein
MAGRPSTYQSEDARPVSVSVRMPRALYDQLQQRVSQRCLTMTEALLEGAQLWLDTPTDPREVVLSDNGTTVIQEWEDRFAALATHMQTQIDTALQAALARIPRAAVAPLPPTVDHPASVVMPYDNGNTVLQEGAPALKQCRKGHDPYPAQKDGCPACHRERSRGYRRRQADTRLGEVPASPEKGDLL